MTAPERTTPSGNPPRTHGTTTPPAADPALAPCTGWTRSTLEDHARRLLDAVRPYAIGDHARIRLPGPVSVRGEASDGLEGFARTFLLAGFLLHGTRGGEHDDLADWYAQGLTDGVGRRSTGRWPALDLDVGAQQRVEAASVAIALALTRDVVWNRLDPRTRDGLIQWFCGVVGQEFPQNNWIWFQLTVEAFLRSVGVDVALDDAYAVLARNEELVREGGWYSDGGVRRFDHYNSWAFHFYPHLWARIEPERALVEEFRPRLEARLRAYLDDAVRLVGADGAPLAQGRSLVYRFAAAAPFWMGALTGASNVEPGVLRRAAAGIVKHFAENGAPDASGLLTLGWHRTWPDMRQEYSGSGSPYWAAKGLAGLMLPDDHSLWAAAERPLPVEEGDVLDVLGGPGWVVSATAEDGIARIYNAGSDYAEPGQLSRWDVHSAWGTFYTGLAYSTRTLPLMVPPATTPAPNAACLLLADGRGTPRSGFVTRSLELRAGVALAASEHLATTWDDQGPTSHARVAVTSVVRGTWEIRVVDVDALVDPDDLALCATGWPLAGAGVDAVRHPTATVSASDGAGPDALTSTVSLLATEPARARATTVDLRHEDGTSPLGPVVRVPQVLVPLHSSDEQVTVVVAVRLGTGVPATLPSVALRPGSLQITWPDRTATHVSRRRGRWHLARHRTPG